MATNRRLRQVELTLHYRLRCGCGRTRKYTVFNWDSLTDKPVADMVGWLERRASRWEQGHHCKKVEPL